MENYSSITPTPELQTLQAELRASHAASPERWDLMFRPIPQVVTWRFSEGSDTCPGHPAEQLRGGLNPEASP